MRCQPIGIILRVTSQFYVNTLLHMTSEYIYLTFTATSQVFPNNGVHPQRRFCSTSARTDKCVSLLGEYQNIMKVGGWVSGWVGEWVGGRWGCN